LNFVRFFYIKFCFRKEITDYTNYLRQIFKEDLKNRKGKKAALIKCQKQDRFVDVVVVVVQIFLFLN